MPVDLVTLLSNIPADGPMMKDLDDSSGRTQLSGVSVKGLKTVHDRYANLEEEEEEEEEEIFSYTFSMLNIRMSRTPYNWHTIEVSPVPGCLMPG
jgi:hypothetical protein